MNKLHTPSLDEFHNFRLTRSRSDGLYWAFTKKSELFNLLRRQLLACFFDFLHHFPNAFSELAEVWHRSDLCRLMPPKCGLPLSSSVAPPESRLLLATNVFTVRLLLLLRVVCVSAKWHYNTSNLQ